VLAEKKWTPPSAYALAHSGPSRAVCVGCGGTIAAYDSRYFGEVGAIHARSHDNREGGCVPDSDHALYPYYYTDG
jgi:hypothetical protein